MLGWIALLAIGAVAASVFRSYPGSTLTLAAFTAAFITLLALVLPKPRLYAYTFLALFLFLGFWAKLTVHLALGFPFVEPIGVFDNSGAAWDRALWVGASGAAGVALSRAVQLAWYRARGVRELAVDDPLPVPSWYAAHRRAAWIALAIGIAGLNLWNAYASFYQIGVNPRLILPLRLNILVAWLLNIGFALLVATLVRWEMRDQPRRTFLALLAPLAEALACSVSTLSRSAYVLHVGPYLLAAWERRRDPVTRICSRIRVRLGAALLAGFLASIVGVQALRASAYFAPVATPSQMTPATTAVPFGKSYFVQLMQQVPWLIVHRWVGLEGVLTVTSYSGTGPELMREALAESPKMGNTALYQRMAHSFYMGSERFTFLTLPGFVAVLAYSGSLVVVLLGAAAVGALVLATEVTATRLVGNPFVLAVAGAAIANVASNLNFPYLAAVFIGELWLTLALIRLLHFDRNAGPRSDLHRV